MISHGFGLPRPQATNTTKAMSLLLSFPGTELIYKDSHSITTAAVWTVVRVTHDLDGLPCEEDFIYFSMRELIELIGDKATFHEHEYSLCYWTGDQWSDQYTLPSDKGIPREVVEKVETELISRRQGDK